MKDLKEKMERHLLLTQKLTAIKAEEMTLRKELAAHFLKNRHQGTYHFDVEDLHAKAVKRMTTSLDEKELSGMYDDFSAEERDCVKFKPSLIMKSYSALNPESRPYLDMCIIVKPAAPQLVITRVEEGSV